MRYKVGDKVRVRSDLNEDMTCNEFIVTTPMADKAGDIALLPRPPQAAVLKKKKG